MAVSTAAEEEAEVEQLNISRNVRLLMVRDDLTQQELGEQLGHKQTNVSGRLRGQIPWSIRDLVRLSSVFDVPLEVFLTDPKELWPRPLPRPETDSGYPNIARYSSVKSAA